MSKNATLRASRFSCGWNKSLRPSALRLRQEESRQAWLRRAAAPRRTSAAAQSATPEPGTAVVGGGNPGAARGARPRPVQGLRGAGSVRGRQGRLPEAEGIPPPSPQPRTNAAAFKRQEKLRGGKRIYGPTSTSAEPLRAFAGRLLGKPDDVREVPFPGAAAPPAAARGARSSRLSSSDPARSRPRDNGGRASESGGRGAGRPHPTTAPLRCRAAPAPLPPRQPPYPGSLPPARPRSVPRWQPRGSPGRGGRGGSGGGSGGGWGRWPRGRGFVGSGGSSPPRSPHPRRWLTRPRPPREQEGARDGVGEGRGGAVAPRLAEPQPPGSR